MPHSLVVVLQEVMWSELFEHRSEGEALELPSGRLEVDGCESGRSFHSVCPVSG